jgi:hypothetical protein
VKIPHKKFDIPRGPEARISDPFRQSSTQPHSHFGFTLPDELPVQRAFLLPGETTMITFKTTVDLNKHITDYPAYPAVKEQAGVAKLSVLIL